MELVRLEVVYPHESVLAGHRDVLRVGREGETVDGSVTNGPAEEEGRLVLVFDGGNDGVLDFRVRLELYGASGLASEDCVPEIEISAAMGGDKLGL